MPSFPVRRRAKRILADSLRCNSLSDSELKAQAKKTSAQLRGGRRIQRNEDRLIALSLEATDRELGIRHRVVQIVGALTLSCRRIAEMQTGEGKTITAVPAVCLLAAHRRGVHVMTANDYLLIRWCHPSIQS